MTLTIQAQAQQTITDSVLKNTLLLIESLKDNYREYSIRGHQHSLNRFDATPGYHQQKIDELKSGKCDIDYQIVTGKKYHKVVYVDGGGNAQYIASLINRRVKFISLPVGNHLPKVLDSTCD